MKQHINNETSTIFEQEHYIGTIIITTGTKNKFLLEFFFFLICYIIHLMDLLFCHL